MQKALLTVLICLLFLPLSSYASIYGILKGKVVDGEGKPVIGASVMIEGTNRGTYIKEKDGSFTIVNIVAGKHTVLVRAIGFGDYRAELFISADQTSTLNIKLLPKDVTLKEIVITDNIMVDKTAIGPVK